MACYSILRIGPLIDDNAVLLRSAILSHLNKSTSIGGNPAEDQINITNRYFDAAVLLKGLHESVSLDGALLQEDGVILMFDASDEAAPSQSFDSLQHIHSSIDETAGELLRLCVGVAVGPSPLLDGSKQSEEEYSRRVLWCLDRGYEYVEVDLSEEGMKRGHDARDKDGFARVVEAVECCMWSSHVMKPRGSASKVDAKQERAEAISADVGGDRNTDTEVETKVDSTTNNAVDVKREADAIASLMKEVKEAHPQDNTHDDSRQQEIAFSELEKVMTEAKRIREASQNDSMTDEERRQRAGDTAVRLMGLLEKLGFDDGDEEEEDDSDADEHYDTLLTT